jgi:hypothetical protein
MANDFNITSSQKVELDKIRTRNPQVSWNNITNKPTAFNPSAHEHTSSNITDLTTIIANAITAAKLAEHPVGSLLMSTVNTNPSTYIGGTWAAWGSGRVPVGVNTSDSDFNAAEKTGGAKTHTLTLSQIPNHQHEIYETQNVGEPGYRPVLATTGGWGPTPEFTNGVGGGGSHNNLQPYITCFMWKRTA